MGVLLGELPISSGCSFNLESKELEFTLHCNPAIYVPDLKKVIFGAESWWGKITKPEDLTDITQTEINSLWYVQCSKSIKSE